MRHFILFTIIFVILSFQTSRADDEFVEPPPAIKQIELNTQDISIHLGLKIYKYLLRVPSNSSVKIILENKKNNKNLIEFLPEILDGFEYSLKFSFSREDDLQGNPFSHENKFLVYEINWNQYQTRSGSMRNFLYGYKNQSSTIFANNFGGNFDKKISIIKFYGRQEDETDETYIADGGQRAKIKKGLTENIS